MRRAGEGSGDASLRVAKRTRARRRRRASGLCLVRAGDRLKGFAAFVSARVAQKGLRLYA